MAWLLCLAAVLTVITIFGVRAIEAHQQAVANQRAQQAFCSSGDGLAQQVLCSQTTSTSTPPVQAPTAPATPAPTVPTPTTTPSCPQGFEQSSYGGCIDKRHLPCPPGYRGWQNSVIDNCMQIPDPLQSR